MEEVSGGWNLSLWGLVKDELVWGVSCGVVCYTRVEGWFCRSCRGFEVYYICGLGGNDYTVILYDFRGMIDFDFYCFKIIFGFFEGVS